MRWTEKEKEKEKEKRKNRARRQLFIWQADPHPCEITGAWLSFVLLSREF